MNFSRLKKANAIARKIFRKYHGFYPEHITAEKHAWFPDGIDGHLGVYRKTRVFCSNPYCCGNPRKQKKGNGWNGSRRTVQERKAPTINEEWY